MDRMDRRTFVSAGASALAALALPKRLLGQACGTPTSADRYGYGPFYLENAPSRKSMALPEEPGAKLSIAGQVANCGGPVPGVSLEVWHATDSGCYIHPLQASCPDHGNPQVSRLWASLVSDADGKFAFDTIKPGVYLNGSTYRPSHIHFRIRSPQGAASPVDVVTQLYFQGDPYIAGDYGADEPNAKPRTIALARADAQSPFQGVFNITLPGGDTGLDPLSDPALSAFDAFVQRKGDSFLIHLPGLRKSRQVELRLYDARGALLRRSVQKSAPVEVDASPLPRGSYQAELLWWTDNGLRTEAVTLRK
jgi:protocatechuate 3,4-dioxygenase beta subunit